MKTSDLVLCVGVIIFLFGILSISDNNIQKNGTNIAIWSSPSSYEEYDPIVILSNDDFSTQGWAGDGSPENPFSIQFVNITSAETCVNISDTTAYFVIENCIISSNTPSEQTGIHIQNASHGVVRNCIIERHGHGLYLNASTRFFLFNNTAIKNSYDGFFIDHSDYYIMEMNNVYNTFGGNANGYVIFYSSHCFINNNTATWNPGRGFFVTDSTNCTVVNCRSDSNADGGFFIRRVSNSTFTNNTVNHNYDIGFYLYYVESCSFVQNIMNYNSGYGFYLYESTNCIIDENEVFSNDRAAYLDFSSSCNLTMNEFFGCETGLEIYHSVQIFTSDNQIHDNTIDGIFVSYSVNCVIESNNISTNSMNGIFVTSSSFIKIASNLIIMNGKDGVRFELVDDSEMLSNCICNNTDNGAIIYMSPNRCKILNNSIIFNQWGLCIQESPETNVSYNYLHKNTRGGLVLWDSSYCYITLNEFSRDGVHIVDAGPESSWNHTFYGNLVNAKPIGYFIDESGTVIDNGDFGQIIISQSKNITVRNAILNLTDYGIQIGYSINCTVINCTTISNIVGFWLYQSDFCKVINCTIDENVEIGIRVYHNSNFSMEGNTLRVNGVYASVFFASENSTIISNSLLDNVGDAIHLSAQCNGSKIISNVICGNRRGVYITSDECVIQDNSIFHNNWEGIYAFSVSGIEISNNTIIGSLLEGILLEGLCTFNQIKYNKLGWNSGGNTDDSDMSSNWDDGMSLGNYWDDYSGTGIYPIQGTAGSIDNWPRQLIDLIGPSINSPPDISFECGTLGNRIEWGAFDAYPNNYIIFDNGNIIDEQTWFGQNISYFVDFLGFGYHNICIQLFDFGGLSTMDCVNVFIVDTIPPSIEGEGAISIFENIGSNYVTWIVSDYNPMTYFIHINNTQIVSETWTSGVISFTIDYLSLGIYNITLEIYDAALNRMTNTVWVTVSDITTPIIISPSDFDYIEGMENQSISWIAIDLHPSRCRILLNDSIVIEEDWNESSIVVSVDGLTVGVYNYTLVVFDTSGNNASDYVIVTVTEAPPTTPITTMDETDTGTENTQLPAQLILIITTISSMFVIVLIVIRSRKT